MSILTSVVSQAAITEWVWVWIIIWFMVTMFGFIMKDQIVRAFGSVLGILFGIYYIISGPVPAIVFICVNLYLLYSAVFR